MALLLNDEIFSISIRENGKHGFPRKQSGSGIVVGKSSSFVGEGEDPALLPPHGKHAPGSQTLKTQLSLLPQCGKHAPGSEESTVEKGRESRGKEGKLAGGEKT